jgi:hypothetical protein
MIIPISTMDHVKTNPVSGPLVGGQEHPKAKIKLRRGLGIALTFEIFRGISGSRPNPLSVFAKSRMGSSIATMASCLSVQAVFVLATKRGCRRSGGGPHTDDLPDIVTAMNLTKSRESSRRSHWQSSNYRLQKIRAFQAYSARDKNSSVDERLAVVVLILYRRGSPILRAIRDWLRVRKFRFPQYVSELSCLSKFYRSSPLLLSRFMF